VSVGDANLVFYYLDCLAVTCSRFLTLFAFRFHLAYLLSKGHGALQSSW
jgi:hypothetical protein